MNMEKQKQTPTNITDTNDNDWETCYSDDDDYIDYIKSMGNVKIGSSGIKMKEGKYFKELEEQNNSMSQQSIQDQFDEPSIDEHSNYSFDYSILSEINDLSFLTNGQNLQSLLNNNSINTLQDEIDNAIDKEALINPDTSLIAKTFFNSNEESNLSTFLPPSVKENYNFLSTEPTETGTVTLPVKEITSEPSTPPKENNHITQTNANNNENFNPMFINRISSFPIVQQSVQAIKSTNIGSFADKTLKRVASTRLPVITVPKLSNLPKIVGKKENNKNKKSEFIPSNSITLEDATKYLPGLATMDNIGCKTLDKLEENFPMINDPDLLEKILNRLEELREIGENTYVVQSSLNSLQNMHNRLNRYNSVIVRGNNNKNSLGNSSLNHRHSISVATTQTLTSNTTYHDKNFNVSSKINSSTTTTAKTSVETVHGCCCNCKCHEQSKDNSIDIQNLIYQQQENLIKSTYQNLHEVQPKEQQPSKTNFFIRRSQKPGILKEIINIRANLQNNINSIPNVMYGRINNVLSALEKKLLNGTELEKEMIAKVDLQENHNKEKRKMVAIDSINSNDNINNRILKYLNKFTEEPSIYTNAPPHNGSIKTTFTTTMTTSTSTTSTVTTTINSNPNSNNDHSISSPLPPYRHYRMASSSDYETDSTLYSPSLSVYSSRSSASSPFISASTPTIPEAKEVLEIKDHDISPQALQNDNNAINNNNNNNIRGSNVHDLYSFLEEVNKLLSIYLITHNKTSQNLPSN